MNIFALKVDDGYGGFIYSLTPAGYFALGALFVLLMIGIYLVNRNREKLNVSTKQLVFSALAVALAIVASNLKIVKMPMGGSVTLLSMLFICMIGYWYGLRVGVMTGVAYGLIQLIIDPYIVSVPQMVIDYFLAFGALGLSGLFAGKIKGLIPGYIVGVFGRYVFSILSGVIFFAAYAPENMNPFVYSVLYNGAYLGAEAAITVIILAVPQVSKAMQHTKKMAVQ